VIPPELVARFGRDGFVVVPDLLTDDELTRFGPSVDAAVADRQRHDHRSLAEKSRYEQSFQQCMNLWEDHPDVLPLTFHPRLGQAAAELLGVSAVRLWHDQALYKEAGGRETDPHQDHPYWPIAEHDQVTAWIPLDGSTRDTGAMSYVPGSHRVGLDRFVDIFGVFGNEPEDILAHPDVASTEPVLVEVPRGAVAFHHGLTVHLARPNLSDHVRRVHTVIYFRDGCTRSSPFPHPSVERNGIEIGGLIGGDVTPIVWPRPDGSFPSPPAVRGQ
jgi:ectoine hydroxylase-related dioxygenase (phytanoyl-CoA dioxygenase family)